VSDGVKNDLTFKQALEKLGIEDFSKRIFSSNSHGELFHLYDYIQIAQCFEEVSWFREWFLLMVDFAEKNWNRPESVFQHIPRLLRETLAA